MEFGIFDIMQIHPDTPSRDAYEQHLADVELADQLGLEYYMAAERHFMSLYRTPAPSVWLGAVAARTTRIRLGVLAYTLPLHNPVRLAEEVSMLDHLSRGRIEVGVGLGHRPEELASLGIDPRHRQALMLEGLVVMQRAWRGETFHHPGRAFQFRDLFVETPIQEPHPPLWYAGNDPNAASWAARNGLSLAVGFQPNDRLLSPAAAYLAARPGPDATATAARAGRQRVALMRHLYVAESDERAMEEMTRDVMAIGETFAASPKHASGNASKALSRAEAEASVTRMREQDVIIAGNPETCARAIVQAATTLKTDVFLANPYLTGVEARRVRRTLRLYATLVAPRVRELLESASS